MLQISTHKYSIHFNFLNRPQTYFDFNFAYLIECCNLIPNGQSLFLKKLIAFLLLSYFQHF